jgi:hypothetical protein
MTAAAGEALDLRAIGWAYGPHAALPRPALDVYGPDGALVISRTATAAEARATFTAPLAGDYVVVVRAADGGTGGYRLGATQQIEAHVFRPVEERRITGTATRDADDAGVAGLRVRAVRGRAAVGGARTDRQPLPAPGRSRLGLPCRGGRRPGRRDRARPESDDFTAPRDLVVPSTGRSRSTWCAVQTASGVLVEVESARTDVLPGDKVRQATTGATGTLTFSVPVGAVTARAVDPARPGSSPVEVAGTVAEVTPLDLAIDFGVVRVDVSGFVRNVSGTPLAGATVGSSASGPAPTAPDSSYRFTSVLGARS